MAKLPPAVQRQVEAADALLSQANAPTEPQDTGDEGQAPPTDAGTEDTTQPPAQAPAPAPEPKNAPTNDVWEQRYKSLQGLFNQKVPELQRQNEVLQADLKAAIERLNQAAKDTAPAPASQSVADPKDVDNFGQDLVEMVQRQTRAQLGSLVAKMDEMVSAFDKRVASLEQAVKGTNQTVAMTAEEVFFTKLAASVPDWEQINADERFLAWLSEVDPVYGQPRQAALTAAQQAMDVRRVANVFSAFKSTLPAAPKTNPLEKQISPNAGAAAPAPAERAPRTYTQAEVARFYDDVRKGVYRGREAEAAKLEQAFNQALQEGRIR